MMMLHQKYHQLKLNFSLLYNILIFKGSNCSPTKRFMDELKYQTDRLESIIKSPNPKPQDRNKSMKRLPPGPALRISDPNLNARKSGIRKSTHRAKLPPI